MLTKTGEFKPPISHDFRRLIALCKGLQNQSIPSDLVRLIVLDEKERMSLNNVQCVVDYASQLNRLLFSVNDSICSLKSIVFRDGFDVVNLSGHPIESYENTHFGMMLADLDDYGEPLIMNNELDLSYTTMNAHKLKQIKFPLHLQYLRLSGNPNISSFESVSFPSTLRRIDLSGCSMDARKIKSLKLPEGVEAIIMNGNDLHGQLDAVSELIAGLPQIHGLELNECIKLRTQTLQTIKCL